MTESAERFPDLVRITRLAAPPAVPVAAGDAGAWAAVEAELGITLPGDYKALIASYGWGVFDRFLYVMTPFSRPGERLLDLGSEMLRALHRDRDDGVPIPYPLHPEPGGLLGWGYTANGDNGYWLTDPPSDPERWRIVFNEARSDDVYWEHPGPLTAALADLLSGRIRPPIFPSAFPSEDLRFDPGPAP